VFNTIGNLLTKDQQVACFNNAAAHLEPGGYFLIEVGVPDLRRLPPGEDARVFAHAAGYVGFDHYVDPVAPQAVSDHVVSATTAYASRQPRSAILFSSLEVIEDHQAAGDADA
jgi:hypothetical protein